MPPKKPAAAEPGVQTVNKTTRVGQIHLNASLPSSRTRPSTSTATQYNNFINKLKLRKKNDKNVLNELIKILEKKITNNREQILIRRRLLNNHYYKFIDILTHNNITHSNIKTNIKKTIKRMAKFLLSNYKLENKVIYLLEKLPKENFNEYKEQIKNNGQQNNDIITLIVPFIIDKIKGNNKKTSSRLIRTILASGKYNCLLQLNENKLAEFYSEYVRQNKKDNKITNINIDADTFFLMMSKDMIHDSGSINVDDFINNFKKIAETILDVEFNNIHKSKLRNSLLQFKAIRNTNNTNKIIKGQIENSFKNDLQTYFNNNNKSLIISTLLSGYNNFPNINIKNIVVHRFRRSSKKHYPIFDVIVNSNSDGIISKFIKSLHISNTRDGKETKTPIGIQSITIPQLLDAGIHKISFDPSKKLLQQLQKPKEKNHFMFNERGVNLKINLIGSGSFRLQHDYSNSCKKYVTYLNGNPINIVTAKNAIKNIKNAVGKFLGDLMMILKIISESKTNVSKRKTVFGTIDKSAALIYIKLANLQGIKPRLMYARANPNRPFYKDLILYGMDDIISKRYTNKTRKRTRVRHEKTHQYNINDSNNNHIIGSSNKSNTNNNWKKEQTNNNNITNNNFMRYLLGTPEKTKTKRPKSPNTSPRKQIVRTPRKNSLKGIKNELARRMGRSPKK